MIFMITPFRFEIRLIQRYQVPEFVCFCAEAASENMVLQKGQAVARQAACSIKRLLVTEVVNLSLL